MKHNFTQRFEEYYDIAGINFCNIRNVLWYNYQKSIIPLGPAKFDYSLKHDEIKHLLKIFSSSILIRCTDGFSEDSSSKCPDWYSIIKNKFVDRESLKSYEARKKILRGVNSCIVERIDAEFISRHGFDIFYAAFKNYRGKVEADLNKEEFYRKYIIREKFPDLFHYWGVFQDSKLIGYAENLIFDNIEAAYSSMKFNPEKLDQYPSYSLIYKMDDYYLKQNNFEYVNDGFRSIVHKTNIQDFLIKNFQFHKKFTNLKIYYNSLAFLAVSVLYPFRSLLKISDRRFNKINALLKMESLRRKCIRFYH